MKLLLVCFITSFLSVFILQPPVYAKNNFPKSKAPDSTEVKSIIPSTLTTCADLKEEITKIALKHDIASLISDRISLILQDDSNHLKGNKETFNLFYFLHFQSHCLLKGQVSSTDLLRGNFNDFETLVDGIQGFLAVQKSLTLQFAKFLLLNGHRLSDILSLKLQWNLAPDSNTRFQKYEKALVTPGIQSMFEHCKKKLEWDSPDWKLNIQKGYQSPINQFIEFVLSSNNIKSAISLSTPPYYGGHHLNIPDITVNLISINSEERPPPWNRVYHLCDEFGFTPKMPGKAKFEGELEFRGIKKLYEPIFSNTLVPRRFAREFE